MAAEDSLLFIDANIYLDLYRNPYGPEILDELADIYARIFATKQVVDEVKRHRKKIATEGLKKFPNIEVTRISKALPEHLLSSQQVIDLGVSLKSTIPGLNKMLDKCKKDLKKQLDRNEDAVTRILDRVFQNPVIHTAEILERARERRDRGNPPGKGTKVGDQLNWEQLLVGFHGKGKLWIISRDKDYGIFTDGKGFLHELLYDELREINKEAKAYLFDDLGKGIREFKMVIARHES